MVTTYKKTGVDITEIKKSQRAIGQIISSTHKTQKLAKVAHGFGHYAGIVQIPGNKFLATHTDGVGTKIIIANMLKKYDTIGIDCIAMNVNDIICIGATPISFVDYIAANKNNQSIFKKVVRGLAKGARQAQVPIIGGETAIMPDLFSGKSFAMDLAGTVVGILSKKDMMLTGGSFTKLLRLKNIGYDLDNLPKTPPLMQLIQDCGVESKEMYKTFNMGIGFCIISPKNNVAKIRSIFKKHRLATYEIGKITSKKGVFINSKKIA
jgi:phosphoribosylaminoimidazole (AIR) synthetase